MLFRRSRSSSGSADPRKPLAWTDPSGNTYHYFEHPFFNATIFVLSMEMCERLAFTGLLPNLKNFLNEFLDYDDSTAYSYISDFQAIMYFTPLIGAAIADTLLGLYKTIIIFAAIYMLGLLFVVLAAVPSISQPWMVHLGLMTLIGLGSGGIKSCVNVMGAQQFHPELHKSDITRYYTYFYASIQIGSIIGGIVTPLMVEGVSYFAAFCVPLAAFVVGFAIFLFASFTNRYVKPKPQGSAVVQVAKVIGSACMKCSLEKCKKSRGGKYEDSFIEDAKMLFRLVPLFCLIIPFMIAYQQMTTAWVTQGSKMNRDTFGWDIPVPLMQNVDPIAVALTSVVVDGALYPNLRRWGIMPSPLVRCAIGSFSGAVALVCSLIVEYVVMAHPVFTISIWWQVLQYWFIAVGEIFLVSTSYEIAFTNSPSSLKAVASAVNLLFFSIAGLISGALFNACSSWMPTFDPSDPTEDSVKGAHYDYFFILLAVISGIGGICALAMIPYYNKVSRENQAHLEEEAVLSKSSDLSLKEHAEKAESSEV
ncbi:hypothetical protein FOZ61_004940 [Perkinsus olseni]|uniref:Uncharacterized protein n=1 Tax=Perkinsus olseni TaxID=32597 RepID=A0A7J6MC51_PEROL|nr:hypothetical protein FOL46_004142 [Perkinsus olseni]KAF4669104.1 hypothetical protein FOZ61_004940 [Perkinsus olseni]